MSKQVLVALAILASGCSSSTTTSPSPVTPSTFVMTWPTLAFPATGVGKTTIVVVAITLSNTGTAPVPVASVTDSNTAEFPWTTTCRVGGTLAASSACAVTVTFTPSALGARTATLAINANSATQTFALTGTGATIDPQVVLASAGDVAPTVFTLAVTGATPSGPLALHTIYTPDPGSAPKAFDVTNWTADSTGAVTASVTTESPGTYEHWLVDLTSGLSTNHVVHRMQ